MAAHATAPLHELLSLWADAHVFYDLYDHPSGLRNTEAEAAEQRWRKRVVSGTPHGALIRHNAMFDLLRTAKAALLHVTTEEKLAELLRDGQINPSAGCLVGAIYCSPLFPDGTDSSQYRVHNLGRYILETEAPRAIGPDRIQTNPVVPIIAEAAIPPAAQSNLAGVDYLRLGDIHLRIYQTLEYLFAPAERGSLEEQVMNQIKTSVHFLSLCQETFRRPDSEGAVSFLEECAHAVPALPIIGYLYFEALAEFLVCHQNCEDSAQYHEGGELYTWNYKELLFELRPALIRNFNLATFDPHPAELREYVSSKPAWGVDIRAMLEYVAERVAFFVVSRLIPDAMGVDWRTIVWQFGRVSEAFGPLVGHLIHRLLRNFGRSGLFYFYYDQTKAMQVWNYWNHNNIAIPFNGVLPKGEVGIISVRLTSRPFRETR